MIQSRKRKIFVLVLSIAIIIASASVIWIPHAHECFGVDCTVCDWVEAARDTLIGIAFAVAIWQLSNLAFLFLNTHYFIFLTNSKTPVALKVKLSD